MCLKTSKLPNYSRKSSAVEPKVSLLLSQSSTSETQLSATKSIKFAQ
jgi:hypothetical protein